MAQLIRGQADEEYYDDNMLRLYGSFTTGQRTQATNGGIQLGSLTKFQHSIIEDMVYGVYSNLQMRVDENGQPPAGFSYETFYVGINREPTEAMPDGLSPTERITMTVTSDVVAFSGPVQRSNYMMSGQAFSAGELAWQIYSQDNPSKFPWMNDEDGRRDLNKLKFGSRKVIRLSINLSPALKLDQELRENNLGKDFLAYDKLPADFLKKVAEEIENLKKSYENSEGGTYEGGGTEVGGQP
jgi:hypothetical protein